MGFRSGYQSHIHAGEFHDGNQQAGYQSYVSSANTYQPPVYQTAPTVTTTHSTLFNSHNDHHGHHHHHESEYRPLCCNIL